MKKNKKINYIIGGMAVVSLIISFIEGVFYYGAESFPHPVFNVLLIFENCFKAYGFQSEINLKDVAKQITDSSNNIERIVCYAYTIVLFIAPSCTIALVYKLLERFLRFEFIRRVCSRKRRIIVVGYNDESKRLLENKKKMYRIHLVSLEVPKEKEAELYREGIIVHTVDWLSGKKMEGMASQVELKKAEAIILFESSSAKNFSLYQMFHKGELCSKLRKDVKFFCRCEDGGVQQIIEEYYDSKIYSGTTANVGDLELVSIPELRVRQMLEEHPLHGYYIGSGKPQKEWNLHLLIVGFGKLGQQLLLQAMNMGVVSSQNDILIDVIDYDMQNKKSMFANNFSEDYVETIGEDEFIISKKKADGELRIRFHQMDIRHKQFFKQLSENGNPEVDGIFTYIAICVEDMDVSLHCMSEIKRYLQKNAENGADKKVSIGIRMEANRQMADYLRENTATYENVFVIEETEHALSLETLLHDELTIRAKLFNRIYNEMNIQSKAEFREDEKNGKEEEPDVNIYWRTLPLFRRKSNLAVAQHATVREVGLTNSALEELKRFFAICKMEYQEEKRVWTYECSEDTLILYQSDLMQFPQVSEFSRMEHRRWCYFMASLGWKRAKDDSEAAKRGKKDASQKINPCLCNWNDLVKYKSDYCKYDLMPLLMEYWCEKEKMQVD